MAMPEIEEVKDAALKYDKPTLGRLAQMGQISPTLAVMAGMMRDRIVQSEMKPPSPPTVAEEVMQPMGQRMGLAAAAQAPQQPQQAQPQGQGVDQVPVPQQMFERQGMANGGIVAFQAGGPPPSFADMYSGLDTDLTALAAARKAYMGDMPTESEEERRNRRREEQALRLMEAGLGIAGGTSESFAANLKGALPAIQGYGTDLATQRKEDRDRLAAERAEKGKVFEGVMGSREKAAQLASAEKIAKMQADKETNMKQFATDAIAAEEARLGRPLTEAETAKIRSQSNERYVTLTAALNARGLSAEAAVSGAGTRDKAVDVELYDKSVAYADTAVHRPRSSENETYKAKLKQDRENAKKGITTTFAQDYKDKLAQIYRNKAGGKEPAQSGAAPSNAPKGAKVIGTSNGKPVYQLPDGTQVIQE